jgi:hypothetical protein
MSSGATATAPNTSTNFFVGKGGVMFGGASHVQTVPPLEKNQMVPDYPRLASRSIVVVTASSPNFFAVPVV